MIEQLNPWSIASINARARPRPCKYCGQDRDRDHDNGCGEIALPINLRKRTQTAPDAPIERCWRCTEDIVCLFGSGPYPSDCYRSCPAQIAPDAPVERFDDGTKNGTAK